jgi:glycosyltransferase involved in cell wall biosynthesis
VCHIITTIDRGGAEKQLLTLIENQSKLYSPIYIVPLKGKSELLYDFNLIDNVIVLNEFSKLGTLKQIFALKRILGDFAPDFIHLHLPRAELIFALTSLITKMAQGARVITSRHNDEKFWPSAPKWLSSLTSRFALKPVDAVIAISNAVSQRLISTKEVGFRVPIFVIYYSQNLANIRQNNRFEEKHVLQSVRFLFLGRFVDQKNILFLLNVFKIHQQRFKYDVLNLYGSGPLLNRILDMNVNNVFIHEKEANVDPLLNSNHCLILPSKYEGFGLVLLEAMKAGTPIICSKISAIPEVVGSNYPGLYCPDSTRGLLKKMASTRDVGVLKSWSIAGQKRVLKFDPRIMTQSISEAYEGLGRRTYRTRNNP